MSVVRKSQCWVVNLHMQGASPAEVAEKLYFWATPGEVQDPNGPAPTGSWFMDPPPSPSPPSKPSVTQDTEGWSFEASQGHSNEWSFEVSQAEATEGPSSPSINQLLQGAEAWATPSQLQNSPNRMLFAVLTPHVSG
jgi:hypothetical protein